MFIRMEDRQTTIRGRELGERLQSAMTASGFTGTDLARRLGWSSSRVSRLLSGKRGVPEVDVVRFMTVCGIAEQEQERLLELCREANTPGLLQQHGDRMPRQLRTLIDHEDKATRISQFEPNFVPGLLQTGDYARALIRSAVNVPGAEVEDRVEARLARQALFDRIPRVQCTFFLHEVALRIPVGAVDVMSEQLHHLLRMSVRSAISLRVVPVHVGGHAGLAGQFELMEFTRFQPVTYLDSETSSLFLEEPSETAAYRRVLAGLADNSLDEQQSRELIADLAVELYSVEEGHDERV